MKKMPGLAIAILKGDKSKSKTELDKDLSEDYSEDEMMDEEVKTDAGKQFIEAMDRKDPMAVYEAMKVLVDLCQ